MFRESGRTWLTVLLSATVISLLPAAVLAGDEAIRLRMATTTSTDNSGLLEYLLPHFEEKTGFTVDVIAVGTGKAIRLAENGDVDIILVHAPAAEIAFVEAGWGVNRRGVMVNDFLIVGPPADPAGLKQAGSLADALGRLKQSGANFLSRGDDSGTHKKERTFWALVEDSGGAANILESGQGMEATLRIAHEKQTYTLTDRGTFLAVGDRLDLVPVFESDPLLENPYSIIAVNPARHLHVKYLEAMRLVAWMTSPEGQALIGAFRMRGEILFHPTAVPLEADRPAPSDPDGS
jgi:tungstate transport system substrate-binding protein